MNFDIDKIRQDFPILQTKVNDKNLVYLDNGATSQKPRQVIEAMSHYYLTENSNANRGAHYLGEKSTLAYDKARKTVAKFINAEKSFEVIFTRNATEGLNLIANVLSQGLQLKEGEEILLSKMEHHSNIVPWQMIAGKTGAKIKYIDITKDYRLDMDNFEKKLSKKTKILAISYVSNVLGVINPIKEITKKAHEFGAVVVVDACQGAPHVKIDVQDLDMDFLAFSAHKMLGPQGVGALYGKRNLLEKFPPFLGGGDMIHEVFLDHFTTASLPNKFEAGTQNIAGAVGFASAIDYIGNIGFDNLKKHEDYLTAFLITELQKLDFIKIIGPTNLENRIGVVSFEMKGVHPHDIGEFLNHEGIAIRTGHHCCQPLMHDLSVNSTARVSIYLYNTLEEIEFFIEKLVECWRFFG